MPYDDCMKLCDTMVPQYGEPGISHAFNSAQYKAYHFVGGEKYIPNKQLRDKWHGLFPAKDFTLVWLVYGVGWRTNMRLERPSSQMCRM